MIQSGMPRLDPRVRLRLRLDVTPRWNGARRVQMETIDLSGAGAALLSPVYLPLKTQVLVSLRLPRLAGEGAVDLEVEAVVVNVEEIGHEREWWRAGVYFLNLSQPDQHALRRFVYRALEAPGDRLASPGAQG
ncbi:MAG TPA: PilZ domain-containing protein [Candidatus Polarisedimenticolia bacterium]|jgi:c-di-GMP-binding flagellar brake protein YcgR